jgi:phosphohistidine phosphatase
MKLYLVRHGEAKSETEDSKRPLSDIGVMEINKIANFLSVQKNINLKNIFHSGKERARETAEIISEKLGLEDIVQEAKNLKPMDDPAIWAKDIESFDGDIMLVGHLPYMSCLLSRLIVQNEDAEIFDFDTGGIACLEKDDRGWILVWGITSGNC